jgi:hypothetical protein
MELFFYVYVNHWGSCENINAESVGMGWSGILHFL